MLLLVILLAAGAALLGSVAVGVAVAERAQVRQSLRRLDGYTLVAPREEEMLEPLSERVLAPLARGTVALARRYSPSGYVEGLKRRIVLAGNPPGYEVDRLLVLKVLGAASGIVWFPLVAWGLGFKGLFALITIGFLWLVSFLGPDLTLNRKVADRQDEIRRRLPDMLDLLVISVEAGLGFEQALDRTSTSVPGPLSEEFRRTLQDIRLGASRADALRAFDERTDTAELRSFILAMLQADTFGVSIAKILGIQAEEMRVRRRQRAQELAQQAPIKLLVPLVFCIFPAIFVVVLGPAMIEITNTL